MVIGGKYLKSLVEGLIFRLYLTGSPAPFQVGKKFFFKNLQMPEAPFGAFREGEAYDLSLKNGTDLRFFSIAPQIPGNHIAAGKGNGMQRSGKLIFLFKIFRFPAVYHHAVIDFIVAEAARGGIGQLFKPLLLPHRLKHISIFERLIKGFVGFSDKKMVEKAIDRHSQKGWQHSHADKHFRGAFLQIGHTRPAGQQEEKQR